MEHNFHEDQLESFEVLIEEHVDSMFNTAVKLCGSPSDAEDLVQETYYRAYRSFDKFKHASSFKTWLHQILRNTYINSYRKNLKSVDTVDIDSIDEVSDQLIDEQFLAKFTMKQLHTDSDLFTGEVKSALKGISEENKKCVVLKDVEGFSYKEIAEMLGLPIGTVMSKVHRARKTLYNLLLDYAKETGYADESSKELDLNG